MGEDGQVMLGLGGAAVAHRLVEAELAGLDDAAAAAPPPPPPAFLTEPPMPWAPVGSSAAMPVGPGTTPLRGDRPWGMVDPGPVLDGRWASRGYASSSQRAGFVRLVLALQIALDIVVVLFVRALDWAVEGGVRLTAGQAGVVNTLVGLIDPVSIAVGLVVMLGIFAWISRVDENIPALTGRTPRHSPRESIGWWFVPLASWWVPFTIVRDAAWRLRTTTDDAAVRLVLPWWVLHVAAAITGLVVGRGLVGLDPATAGLVAQVVVVTEALGDVLLIAVVASVARNERTQAARLDFSGRRGPEWPQFAPLPPEGAPDDALEDASDWYRRGSLMARRAAARPDDPLAQAPDERPDDYEARLLAALEAEATQH
ncbi:MAG: DUF4328 domain-containing protein [Candidatus Limnocylindrales bacterium]